MRQAIRLRKERNIQRDDFLNYLLELDKKKSMKEIEMAAHTMSFFLDGFETSSNVISLTLYELAKNQRVQEKLRKEVTEVGDVTFDSVKNLPYLDQVLHESLRMHPPLSVIARIATEDAELKTSKDKTIKVEKGVTVSIPAYSFHYDSDYYENPEEFKPERFDPENGGLKKYKDMGVYLSFGDGPRICLGMRFALMQSKAAIAKLVKSFDITLNEKTHKEMVYDPKMFITYPIGGVWLDMKPRQ